MKLPLAAITALLLVTGCSTADTFRLTINGVVLDVEVADTEETRARGLMFRESMKETAGMLFVFEQAATRAFYMRNTRIPLSIAYIDERRVIREIHDMDPFSLESVYSRNPAMYALELNQGAFERLGISPGDRLQFSKSLAGRIGK